MTPEERFTKIENLLHSLTESQVQFQVELQEMKTQIAQHDAGVRDLIVVSRAFLESQKEVTTQIRELREAQRTTDEKLHALIDTVERIIRNQNN